MLQYNYVILSPLESGYITMPSVPVFYLATALFVVFQPMWVNLTPEAVLVQCSFNKCKRGTV